MVKPLIIGITGGSGSGKTSFIRRLKERFSEHQICVISQDDYYRPREEQLQDEQGIHNFDLPESIDAYSFARDIEQLIEGQPVNRPEYKFNNELAESKMLTFKPAPILLVEGLFIYHFHEIRRLFDIRIFLHAKENLKIIRRIKRDRVERNYPLEDVLYRYEHHVLPTFEKYIQPYMDEADIIINNNLHFDRGLEMLTGYLFHYLQVGREKFNFKQEKQDGV
jgi:uridine kinase